MHQACIVVSFEPALRCMQNIYLYTSCIHVCMYNGPVFLDIGPASCQVTYASSGGCASFSDKLLISGFENNKKLKCSCSSNCFMPNFYVPCCEDIGCTETCEPLSDPNGRVTYEPDTNTPVIRTVATYTCNEGYTLIGSTARVCEGRQGWTGLSYTSCERKNA